MSTADTGHRAAGRFVGARVQRVEDPRLLTGNGRYVDDVKLPGMLHAAFLRSPLAHARIRSIDAQQALLVPGVVAVWTGPELNGDVTGPLWNPGTEEFAYPPVYPLASGSVRHVGDPVAMVIAGDRYVAEDALELIDVDYEPLPAVIGRRHALQTTDTAHDELDDNLAWSAVSADPELDAVLARSAHVFTHTMQQHRYVAVPMEPRGIVADWHPGEQQLVAYVASQGPHLDRTNLATQLGLPEHRVRVIQRDVGGSFGQKIFRGREETAAVLASRRLGRPVKWIEDRTENLTAASHSRDEEMTLRIGVDEDGTIQAIQADYLNDVGAYPGFGGAMPGVLALTVLPGPYRVPHYEWSGKSVFTNTGSQGAYRGPWLMETVAREIMMDVVARGLGMDPAELRRRNLLSAEEMPYKTVTGRNYDRMTPAEVFEAALAEIGYGEFRERQRELRDQGRYLGIGLCTYIEPTASPIGRGAVEVATVRIEPSGKINVLTGTGSHGHSIETTIAQVVADQLGVPLEDVRILQGDSAISPYGGGTAGSRTAVMAGGAARVSATQLREKVLAIAGHLLEAAPEDLEIELGTISVKGAPGATISFADVAETAYHDPRNLPEGIEPGLENTYRYAAPDSTYANSTQICTCEVDVETGIVTLLDYVVGGDYGVLINPMVVEGQVAGGVAQGIGGVLLEHLPYDDRGNPMAITFKDYLLPTAANVPDIRYVHLETPADRPGGAKGVGEGGAIGSPAAVVNAVSDALAPLGVLITDQPLSPDRILALIEAARARSGNPPSAGDGAGPETNPREETAS